MIVTFSGIYYHMFTYWRSLASKMSNANLDFVKHWTQLDQTESVQLLTTVFVFRLRCNLNKERKNGEKMDNILL